MQRVLSLLVLLAAFAVTSAINTHAADDETRSCVMATWMGSMLTPGPQAHEVKPDIPFEGDIIRPVVFGPLAGEFPKFFMFLRIDANGCDTAVVSIGSYESTTQIARATGSIGPEKRLYHADLYEPGSQSLLGWFAKPPSYDNALEFALEHLK